MSPSPLTCTSSTCDFPSNFCGAKPSRYWWCSSSAIRANVDVYRGGQYLGRYRPGKNQYFAEDQVSNEVSIRHDLLTGGDLFLIADQVNADGKKRKAPA